MLWIGDRRVQGQIMESVQARQTYDEIVGRRIDPALIERIDDQLFRLSVSPFPANGSRRVEIEYMEVLDAREGVTEYVYPLAAEVMGVEVGLFEFSAEVASQIPFDVGITDLYARLSQIDRQDDRHATVRYADEVWSPTEDLTLRVEERVILAEPRLLSFPPTESTMGYYVMWMPPVPELLEAAPLARSVTFVVDNSGSMRVGRLEPLKNALADMLQALVPVDRFNIVWFSSSAQAYSPELLAATPEAIDEAASFVRLLSAGGSTNFEAALQVAYAGLDPDQPHSVVFLTDGQTNTPVERLNDLIAEMDGPGIRLFTIGVGLGVNRGILSALAAGNRGKSRFVTTEERLEEELRLLFDEFSRPVLLSTSLVFEGTRVLDLYPDNADVLAAGRELFQVGRYSAGGMVTVRLTGSLDEEEVSVDYTVELVAEGDALPVIPRLWAHEKVQSLELQMARAGNGELSDDILDLGLKYRLVTSRTSLFAPDDEIVVNPEPELAEADGSATAIEEETAITQTYFDRIFSLNDGVWIDLAYRSGMPLEVVTRIEDTPPALLPFAGLGLDMILVFEERAYQIQSGSLPLQPVLLQNAPNPFNPTTVIAYVLPEGAGARTARMLIYDLAGQLVWDRLVEASPGPHSRVWDGRDNEGRAAATGVYIVELQLGDLRATKRATLQR